MMDSFGDLLRYYRRQSTDPLRGGMLTLERLGGLIGEELGDAGYTAAAVGYWELNRTKISQDNYRVLVAIITVLANCGGIKTPDEANALLTLGNYRSLNDTEKKAIFGVIEASRPATAGKEAQEPLVFPSPLADLLPGIKDEWEYLRTLIRQPAPYPFSWVWDWLGHLGEGFSSEKALYFFIWVIPTLITWGLVFPLLRWPFENKTQLLLGTYAYGAGSLIVPLVIGALTRTKDSLFWHKLYLGRSTILRLYVYQGAFIGFQLGAFTIFAIWLILHYLSFDQIPLWAEGLAAIYIVLVGQSAAHQVPFNMWRAYRRLELKDGAIFFIFVLLGPAEAAFFFKFNGFLLSTILGPLLIIATVFLLLAMQARQQRRTGSPVIPAHLWAAFFGAILVLYQAAITPRLYPPVAVACVVGATVAVVAWQYSDLTFPRAMFGFTIPLLIASAFGFNIWWGLGATAATAVLVLNWPKVAWIPWGFWAVMTASVTGTWLITQSELPDTPVAIGLILTTATILWLQKRLK